MSQLSMFLRASLPRWGSSRRYWSNIGNYDPPWEERAELAATMLADARWICDLGCGPQALRRHLSQSTVYLPADQIKWTLDTELCDLNSGRLPIQSLTLCDTCVMLGVFAYVRDPSWLFGELVRYCEQILFSFVTPGAGDLANRRRRNMLSFDDLSVLLKSNGLIVTASRAHKVSTTILMATNSRFDDQARRTRSTAREQWQYASDSN